MGKNEQILREMADRVAHQTGSGLAVPDGAKSAAQWALGRITELEAHNLQLQKTNEEIGPAYHEWRSYADKLLQTIMDAVLDYQAGRSQEAWNMLVDLIDMSDKAVRAQQQAKVDNKVE